jgi:MMPL family
MYTVPEALSIACLVTGLGLGLGIDNALLVLNRFREELAHGLDTGEGRFWNGLVQHGQVGYGGCWRPRSRITQNADRGDPCWGRFG